MNCQICISPKPKKTISCVKCQETCCFECIKKYISGLNDDPKCMFCKETLSKYDLVKMDLPKSYFSNDFKTIRQDVLFNRDMIYHQSSFRLVPTFKSLMKEKQLNKDNKQLVSKYFVNLSFEKLNDVKKIEKKKLQLTEQLLRLKYKHEDFSHIEKELHLLKNDKDYIQYKYITKLDYNVTRVSNDLLTKEKQLDFNINNENLVFSLFCQDNSCNGVLDKNKCILCFKLYCSTCNTPLLENHSCKKDDILTYNMIKSQTKPCPKCLIPIYKLQGCNEMFCTRCHTRFYWDSGQIVTNTKFYHNPYYFHYLSIIDKDYTPYDVIIKCIQNSDVQYITDLFEDLNDLVYNNTQFVEDPNKKIKRLMFLSNMISKQEYKRFLFKEDKKIELLYNINKVYESFYHKVRNVLGILKNTPDIYKLKIRLSTIKNMTRDLLSKVCDDLESKNLTSFFKPIEKIRI